ncbi:prephenate dehydrogenase [Adhaeribacter swui]|uniref:Prephenate dehydrogenase n=1 Tax=Adhaeribacter swui TaxID=2086471 RepID=A0A7G7GCS7_9BACT|nr:prephenate dehydrogenase [Adhaeribacter swui]QNF34961.1 prephenate dehydrogenase [Adhaeribacter swui]
MRLCIVGIGLLGGSFALGLKDKFPGLTVIGVDSNPEHAQKALDLGIVQEILPLKAAVAQADLIVLATPVNAIVSLLPQVLDLISPAGVVIDLGSTKELICTAVKDHPKRKQFVAVHPIAGTENTGPEAAFASLLPGKTMIICEKENSNPEAVQMVEELCRKLEMRISYMDAASHDLHLAYVSHLSHISSFALGITVLDKEKNEQNIFDMAGSGFSSTVRLAKSSPEMWAPIFTQNGKNISEALTSYIEKLQIFKKIIDQQDETGSYTLMKEANEIRRILQGI